MSTYTRKIAAAAAIACSQFAASAFAANYGPLEHWRSYAGVSWDDSSVKNAAPFSGSVNAPLAGVHVDGKGRYFASMPRFISKDLPATLNLIDVSQTSGPARLTAFPSVASNGVDVQPDQNLRSVLGFYIDRKNGWLWALDMGYVGGEAEAPAGAQKVVVYDLASGAVVKRIPLDPVANRSASFLNDIVVDERRKVAYISDSGLRGNDAGLIVIDFASGKTRRVLDKDPSVQPEAGAGLVAHGLDVLPGKPLRVGINGIALSPDAGTLYWTVTTGQHAHAVSTKLLRNANTSDADIAAQVKSIGDVGGNSDGIVSDKDGDIFITDLTRNGIVKYDSHAKTMTLIASDPGIHWADTLTVLPDGDLLFSSSALNEHFMGAIKPGEERNELWRLPLLKK